MAGNDDMVTLWNSEAAAAWATRFERYDAMLGALGERTLEAAALLPGERVLDVGCGAGQLTLQAAAVVGSTGSVLGVDIAADLVAVAGRRATDAGLCQVEVLQTDAQGHRFTPHVFDAVISRFGVMFFDDPVAAFTNLREATVPGGRLAFVCWQPAPQNEWFTVPLVAVAAHIDVPAPPPPGSAGPFAFGDGDRVRAILSSAGWTDVGLEAVQTTVSPGGARTPAEAVSFITDDTFGRNVLVTASPEARGVALSALEAAYAAHAGPDGIRLNVAVWVVTARA